MTSKQQVFLCLAILVISSMLLLILFGDHGVADLNLLKSERDALVEKNEKLARENLLVYDKINRLKTDLEYIENVARQELGMIGKDELILKPRPAANPQ
jgi:cell division protein FtsB